MKPITVEPRKSLKIRSRANRMSEKGEPDGNKGKGLLWRQRCRWEGAMKPDRKEVGHDVLKWIELAPCNAVVNFHGHIDMLFGTIQEDFCDLNIYTLWK